MIEHIKIHGNKETGIMYRPKYNTRAGKDKKHWNDTTRKIRGFF